MDFIDIIITIAILGVGGLLSGAKKGKKAAPQQSAPRPVARPVFETLFEDDDDILDEDVNEEVFTSDFAEDVNVERETNTQEEYFSYENQDMNQTWKDTFESTEKPDSMTNETVSEETGYFDGKIDIRKAFIYQTILERVNY